MNRKLMLLIGVVALTVAGYAAFGGVAAAKSDHDVLCRIGGGSALSLNFNTATVSDGKRTSTGQNNAVRLTCSGNIGGSPLSQTVIQVGSGAISHGNPGALVVSDTRTCFFGVGGNGLAGPATAGGSQKTNDWTQTIEPDGSVDLSCNFVN